MFIQIWPISLIYKISPSSSDLNTNTAVFPMKMLPALPWNPPALTLPCTPVLRSEAVYYCKESRIC